MNSTTTTTNTSMPQELPKSVRGAPAELRRLIRKRQNSESAKRCRLRRKLEAAKAAVPQLTTQQRMFQLESIVEKLAQQLTQTESAIAILLSRSTARFPHFSSVTALPQPLPSSTSQQLVVPEIQRVGNTSSRVIPELSLPSQPSMSYNTNVPTSPITPTSTTNVLQLPTLVPDSTRSEHTVSNTDSTIRAAQELESENLPHVIVPTEVESPFSDSDFNMASVHASTNFSDSAIFYGALDACSTKNSV